MCTTRMPFVTAINSYIQELDSQNVREMVENMEERDKGRMKINQSIAFTSFMNLQMTRHWQTMMA